MEFRNCENAELYGIFGIVELWTCVNYGMGELRSCGIAEMWSFGNVYIIAEL